eukprot:TRINITY_DN2699_c0_g1_i1.p1 TRINITY_DN2699_c0_g1~~TRINITY_DN2699_c0_g1_i1.p1  ORF type:complete len:303 (-),score=42.07 TRINITY_DN2699_c0_g1_i1:947-1855(-)
MTAVYYLLTVFIELIITRRWLLGYANDVPLVADVSDSLLLFDGQQWRQMLTLPDQLNVSWYSGSNCICRDASRRVWFMRHDLQDTELHRFFCYDPFLNTLRESTPLKFQGYKPTLLVHRNVLYAFLLHWNMPYVWCLDLRDEAKWQQCAVGPVVHTEDTVLLAYDCAAQKAWLVSGVTAWHTLTFRFDTNVFATETSWLRNDLQYLMAHQGRLYVIGSMRVHDNKLVMCFDLRTRRPLFRTEMPRVLTGVRAYVFENRLVVYGRDEGTRENVVQWMALEDQTWTVEEDGSGLFIRKTTQGIV